MMETPATSDGRIDTTAHVSRRRVLGGIAATVTVGTAGCTAIIDGIADQILDDVNVFNETSKRVAGTVEIDGPDGTTVLSETFDLQARSEDDSNDGGTEVYEDVWQTAGSYDVTVELDDDIAVRGESRATESVTIDAPDEEMLAIAFGVEDEAAGIAFAVGESLSEFQ